MSIQQTIIQYLKSHKRLIVPQLGVFIVKTPGGEVLFSELFRRDDGVLRSLLQEEGLGDLEAAGVIDRFVFEVRHALQCGDKYRMEGLGIFRAGDNEAVVFTCEVSSERVSVPNNEPVAIPEPQGKVSGLLHPDPSLKGLCYGKPTKKTNAYTYERTRGRKIDRFLLMAIIATVIAVAAIAYGYVRTSREKQQEEPVEQVEQVIQPEQPKTAAA